MAAFSRFEILRRIIRSARVAVAGLTRSPGAATAEVWCRPATVIALRDPKRAPACVAGWR